MTHNETANSGARPLRARARAVALLAAATLTAAACDRPVPTPPPAASPAALSPPPSPSPAGPPVAHYLDLAADAGLDLVNVCGPDDGGAEVLAETIGTGAAVLDFDGDGRFDIYLVNGSRRGAGAVAGNRLYRNRGRLRFSDVTAAAGVGDTGWGLGAAVGDCDNDGDPDLYVTNLGGNRMFINRGDGTFDDATTPDLAGDETSAGAAFGDFDGDGQLNLYVTNYVVTDLDRPGTRELWRGVVDVVSGPRGLVAQPDRLYRNTGGCRFEDATADWLPAGLVPAYGLGVLTFDYDYDGDTDLLVANDSTPNYLLRNRGDGRFDDVALSAGFAVAEDGRLQGCMGIDEADLDGDGRGDVVITNFSLDYHSVYANRVTGFVDATYSWGLPYATRRELGWGVVLLDFDFDGDADVFFANGHIYKGVEAVEYLTYPQRNQLFANDGGRFVDVSERAGPGLQLLRSSRGVADGDLDNDGRVELVVNNIHDRPSLLVDRFDGAGRGNWLGFHLQGTAGNRDAIGALVRVRTGAREQLREVRTSGSYLAARDPRIRFGLGPAEQADEVTIRWPGGGFQAFERLAAGCYYRLREGGTPRCAEPPTAAQRD